MTTLIGPLAYNPTLGAVSVQVLAQNPGRTALYFFNPSANSIAVCPALTGANAALPAVVAGAGSITILPSGLVTIIGLTCSCAWNAIASGGGTAFTIWEFSG